MRLLLVVLFVVVPIAELYILIQVGHAIGALPTIGLLILDAILGAALLRMEGRRTWRAFTQALEARRVPAREVADGALVVFGGALLITPGFLSDILGLLCILPPTRAALRRLLTGAVGRKMGRKMGAAGVIRLGGRATGPATGPSTAPGPAGPARPRPGDRQGEVIEGEVIDPGTAEGPPPDGGRP
jgi:UPF0716 protein FxsA